METNLRDLTAKTSIACGKPNPRAARSLGSSVKIVVASSALPFWKPSSIVELSRPLPFRAAPSLHFAMSVSAEEVAKHNKDGDVCLREPDVNSVMFWDWACRYVRRRTATAG